MTLFGVVGTAGANAGTHCTEQPVRFNISFPNAVRAGNNTYRLPFTWVGRLPAVTARVDTVEGIFFFDTGAECLLLNKRLFNGGVRSTGRSQYGLTGNGGDVYTQKLDTFRWDNFQIYDINANILSLAHIEKARNVAVAGIIGYDVFKDFEVMLDYGAQLIVLTRLDANGYRIDSKAFQDEEPVDSADVQLARHGVLVNARVEGKMLKMHLDSGAEINLLDRMVSKKVLRQFTVLKRVNLIGATGNKTEVLAGTLAGVETDAQPNEAMRTLLTNLDELSLLLGADVDGVLGYEYLRPRRVLINYKRKKLFFFKPTK